MRGNRALPRHSWAEPAAAQTLLPLTAAHRRCLRVAVSATRSDSALANHRLGGGGVTYAGGPPPASATAPPHSSGPATAACLPGPAVSFVPALAVAACPALAGGVWCRHSTFRVPLISSRLPGTPSHTLVPHARPRVPSCVGGREREAVQTQQRAVERQTGRVERSANAHQAGPDPLHRPVAVVTSPGDTLDGGALAEAGQAGDNLED